MIFVEALFSTNINYKSVAAYKEEADGTIVPDIEYTDCKETLLEAMKIRLCNFTNDFLSLDLTDRSSTIRTLFDYSLDYFNYHQRNPVIIENLADLKYSVTVGGIREYAPALSMEDVQLLNDKKVLQIHLTSSLPMSLARSDKEVVRYHTYLSKQKKEEDKAEKQAKKQLRQQILKDFQSKEYNYTFDRSTTGQRLAYNEAAKAPVEDRVVIINIYDKPESEFASIIDFYSSKGYKIDILPLLGNYKGDDLHALATAKYIYMSNVSGWFSRVKFRKETKLIQLLREPMPLNGLSQTIIPEYSEARVQHMRRIHKVVYSLIPCTGEGVDNAIKDKLIRKENRRRIKVLGNPLTDVYFNEKAKKEIREKLATILPDNGKKLIVYLPLTNESKKFAYHYLDLKGIEKQCADKYNLLVVSNEQGDIISRFAESLSSFAYNGYGIVTQREAMAVADIIIGDCTGTLLEGSLTGKPLFISSPYKAKTDGTALFSDEDMLPCPLVRDGYSLGAYLNQTVEYDFKKLNAFKDKYFGGCDGHSTEKIDAYLQKHPELHSFL